ncbi:hypothetical protein [Nocardiopsis composta]|uniref:Uncharacterized protein n=2 Tax=Nocardiopsis composta TaxID=157465 RepID=A0A7W8QJJ4_9ACTN|nr:hypothetical protein [Nocardiopsis composta]MBB5431404.1 hypothetical protein [Nocardiopsis composta]
MTTSLPSRSRLAEVAEWDDMIVLLIQRGAVAEELLPEIIRLLEARFPEELAYWYALWGHGGVPPEDFTRNYRKYCSHQLGIIVSSDLVIPPQARLLLN